MRIGYLVKRWQRQILDNVLSSQKVLEDDLAEDIVQFLWHKI